jgi:hypothetical protein
VDARDKPGHDASIQTAYASVGKSFVDQRTSEFMSNSLFLPLQVGPYLLKHRVVMAPLTRMRAERVSFAPRTLNAEYYAQRATAGGLIIAEASPVAPTGRRNPATPGIYSDRQIEGWREVTDAVHAKGGTIFSAALARRAGVAFVVAAGRRAAGRAIAGSDYRKRYAGHDGIGQARAL